MNVAILLALSLVVIGLVVFSPREKFQPEFLDKRQVDKTVAVEDSSYAQQTNHVDPAPFSLGPIKGIPTIFQVNQYKSYIA